MENILDNTLIEEQNNQIIYGGFWPRLWALILDGLIFIPLYIVVFFNMLDWKSIPLLIVLSILPIIYKPFWEFRYGTTIGKKAMKLRVTNLNYERPNLQEVLLRNIFYISFGVLNIIFSVLIFSMPEFADITEFLEYGKINQLSSGATMLSYCSSIIYLIEFVMLVIDDKKRSLHDRIGQTYVIKSLYEWQKRI